MKVISAILTALFLSAALGVEKKPNAQPNVVVVSYMSTRVNFSERFELFVFDFPPFQLTFYDLISLFGHVLPTIIAKKFCSDYFTTSNQFTSTARSLRTRRRLHPPSPNRLLMIEQGSSTMKPRQATTKTTRVRLHNIIIATAGGGGGLEGGIVLQNKILSINYCGI